LEKKEKQCCQTLLLPLVDTYICKIKVILNIQQPVAT